MTPIEAAVKAAHEANIIQWHPGDYEDCVMASDIAPIIRAFLDAAAEDRASTIATGLAANGKYGVSLTEMGKAAILALKEAVNAG